MDIVERIEATLDRATQDFDGRDDLLKAAAEEIVRLRAVKPRLVRFCAAEGDTLAEMRDSARKSPLNAHGDMILIWVNQGDHIMHVIETLEP